MPLTGPISPKYYLVYTAPSPNPTFSAFSAFNELIVCNFTGRMWLRRNADVVQALPYVATDNGTTAVKMINDSGNLKCVLPSGATNGSLNVFDKLVVNSTAPYLPSYTGASSGTLYCEAADGKVATSLATRSVLSTDFTATFAGVTSTLTNLTFTPVAAANSVYKFECVLTFYHNNQYTVTAGLQFYRNASNNAVVSSSSVTSQSGGWTTISLYATLTFTTGDTLRVVVAPSVDDVHVKVLPAHTFSSSGFSPLSQASSYLIAQRIG